MLFLLTDSALCADPPATDPTAEALPILQTKYVDFKALNYKQGDTLSDLITRSNGEISLSAPEETASALLPILTATLPGAVIYWRLASFTPKKDWTDLAANLKSMLDAQNPTGAILDLRSNATPDDYAGAARVATLFVPPGSHGLGLKYLLQKEDTEGLPPLPVAGSQFDGPIIVLTNEQTTGAAEALAACLKADGALVIGRATAGYLFEEHPLSSGQVLHFAAVPPDGATKPVVPDIALAVDDRTEKGALVLIKDNQILDVIGESAERHRMSEASLVQGQDPEWDDYLASLERKPVLLSLPVIHDVVLISALDSLKAIRLSQRPCPSAQATADASPPVSTSVQ